MAPKLLGVFPGGRVEEYFHSETCNFDNFLNPEVVAKKMARIHSLNIPISKVPNKMSKAKEMIQGLLDKDNKDLDISRFDPLKEVDWCAENIPKISPGPRVFLLIHDEVELCCYYYRAVDFANFFELRQMQLEKVGEKMKLVTATEEFKKSSQDLKRLFLEEYRSEFGIIRGYEDPHQDSMEQLLMEAEFGRLFIAMVFITFFGNFSEQVSEKGSAIHYCEETLAAYEAKKLSLIEIYGHKLL